MGVDDDDLGARRPVARAFGKAVVSTWATMRPRALVGPNRDGIADRSIHVPVEIGKIAAVGGICPRRYAPDLVGAGIDTVDGGLIASGVLVEALTTQIVRPPLQYRPPHRFRTNAVQGGSDKGKVFGGQLVLQRLCRGGDNGRHTAHNRRHDVGECLAGAGAGLHHQVSTSRDGGGNEFGHFALASAVLCAIDRRGHRVEGGQN